MSYVYNCALLFCFWKIIIPQWQFTVNIYTILFNVHLRLLLKIQCGKLVLNKKELSIEIKYWTLTLVTLSLRISAFENHAHLSSRSAEGWLLRGERNRKIDVQCSRRWFRTGNPWWIFFVIFCAWFRSSRRTLCIKRCKNLRENPRLLTPAWVMNCDGDIDIDISERANADLVRSIRRKVVFIKILLLNYIIWVREWENNSNEVRRIQEFLKRYLISKNNLQHKFMQ